MGVAEASEALEMSRHRYSNMTTEERHEWAYDLFRRCPAKIDEFLGLPDSVEIPVDDFEDALIDDEDIANWLSDTYGYCIEGFSLSTD